MRHPLLSGLMRDESIACLRAHPPSQKVCVRVRVCAERERERMREREREREPVPARAATVAEPCKSVYLSFHTLLIFPCSLSAYSSLRLSVERTPFASSRRLFRVRELLPLDYERVSSVGVW